MAQIAGNSDFDSDSRTACKYGSNCYQKNKNHLEKFKHPPIRPSEKPEKKTDNLEIPAKKPKLQWFKPNNLGLPSKKEKKLNPPSPKKALDKNRANCNNPSLIEDTSSTATMLLSEKKRTAKSRPLTLEKDVKKLIKQLFLVDMPEDFYSFWELCKTMSEKDPLNAFNDVKLKLVGPFDVLAGKVKQVYEEDLPDFLRHWRYYYDPPEFQTVLSCDDMPFFHLGYFRDDPEEPPVFVASNAINMKNPEKNGELKIVGPNIFAAVIAGLEGLKTDPYAQMKIPLLQKTVREWAKAKGFSVEKSSETMEERNGKVVAKTFHTAGIVVPVDKKKDVGYRELAVSNSMLKKILQGIVESKDEDDRKKYREQLQPVITFANIANDECDFGTSLELGLNLFTFGNLRFHSAIRPLLTTAYNLLGRQAFATILQAHLDNRRHLGGLNIL